MRLATATVAVVVACAAAASAFAEPVRINDVQFIAANRCLGLMSSRQLASPDAAALRHFIKDQSIGRTGIVYDEADQARDNAESDANRGGADNTAHLIAERDGLCHGFVASAATTAADGRQTHSS